MNTELSDVLNYRNDRVIEKFREAYYFDRDEAAEIFRELLTWLWLAGTSEPEKPCSMYHPMHVMDSMWHTFLSFTRDYAQFCERYFSRFIHHDPHTRSDAVLRLSTSEDDQNPLDAVYAEIESFQRSVHDRLGPDTLVKWFVTFPHLYSPDEMQRRTRPVSSQHGFMNAERLRNLPKDALISELSKSWHIAAWCGGPNCGAQCEECRGGGGGGSPHPQKQNPSLVTTHG